MKRRAYQSYREYLTHQASKTRRPDIRDRLLVQRKQRMGIFRSELTFLRDVLPAAAEVLCMGARLGEEVEVLCELGFRAVGVDLVACPPHVERGDFQNLRWVDETFDAVYSNSLDHVYDLKRFLDEASRVLRPRGWAAFRLAVGSMGTWESLRIDSEDEIVEPMKDRGFDLADRRPNGGSGPSERVLLLFARDDG